MSSQKPIQPDVPAPVAPERAPTPMIPEFLMRNAENTYSENHPDAENTYSENTYSENHPDADTYVNTYANAETYSDNTTVPVSAFAREEQQQQAVMPLAEANAGLLFCQFFVWIEGVATACCMYANTTVHGCFASCVPHAQLWEDHCNSRKCQFLPDPSATWCTNKAVRDGGNGYRFCNAHAPGFDDHCARGYCQFVNLRDPLWCFNFAQDRVGQMVLCKGHKPTLKKRCQRRNASGSHRTWRETAKKQSCAYEKLQRQHRRLKKQLAVLKTSSASQKKAPVRKKALSRIESRIERMVMDSGSDSGSDSSCSDLDSDVDV
jgi:hypothetical protein